MFTARYGLIPYIKQITFGLQIVKYLTEVYFEGPFVTLHKLQSRKMRYVFISFLALHSVLPTKSLISFSLYHLIL